MAVQGYGAVAPAARPRPSPLTLAASGMSSVTNPFGFQAARNTIGYREPPVSAPVRPVAPVTPSPVSPGRSAATSPLMGVNPSAATIQAAQTPIPKAGGYDVTADPALQQIQATTGMSDEQANAAALAQEQAALLGYGSSDLAKAVLGEGDPTATAAGQNPTSTLAQLAQQQTKNEHDLTEGLNANNLLYSGYRVSQEQQAEQGYQNALAKAAADVNSGLGTIKGNLASTLGQNQSARDKALADATALAIQQAIANGGAGGTGGGAQGGNIIVNGQDTGIPDTANNADLLAAAAAGGGAGAYSGGTYTTAASPFTTTGNTGTSYYQSNKGPQGKKPLF